MIKSYFAIFFAVLGLVMFSCGGTAYPKGQKLYQLYCESCHMEDGTGLGAEIPPLVNADYYSNNLENVPCIIVYGLADTILVNNKIYKQKMEGIPLSPIQVTNVINYINTSWGNNYPPTKLEEVKNILDNCQNQ